MYMENKDARTADITKNSQKELDQDKENRRIWREEYWPTFLETKKDTDDKIDKKVYGISIGGIGFELACLQFKDKDFSNMWVAIVPAALFTISLILNLWSQYEALTQHEKVEKELNKYFNGESKDDKSVYSLIEKGNKIVKDIVTCSIISMILAIIFLIIIFLKML